MTKKKIDIIHIYAGTSGSAGLYLDEIYSALKTNFNQEAIVNFFFPFNYGKRIFYKYSELSSPYLRGLKNTRIRHLVRFAEIIYALLYSYFFIIFGRQIKIINYNLTSDLKIEYLFLFILRRWHGVKLAITCHDVLPFKSAFINSNKQVKRKQAFFTLADFLIIHNANSYNDLVTNFVVDNSRQKIVQFPFPIMDTRKLPSSNIKINSISKNPNIFRVGMVGHLRIEKGVQILLDAWELFYKTENSAELIIAGNLPMGEVYNFDKLKGKGLIIIDKFISDYEYKSLIESCDLLILPYTRGTNSGIPSSIIALNKLLITSDIPMFRDNDLLNKEFMFKSGNAISLASKINWIFSLTEDKKTSLQKHNDLILNSYKKRFVQEINDVYINICSI